MQEPIPAIDCHPNSGWNRRWGTQPTHSNMFTHRAEDTITYGERAAIDGIDRSPGNAIVGRTIEIVKIGKIRGRCLRLRWMPDICRSRYKRIARLFQNLSSEGLHRPRSTWADIHMVARIADGADAIGIDSGNGRRSSSARRPLKRKYFPSRLRHNEADQCGRTAPSDRRGCEWCPCHRHRHRWHC